MYLFSASFCCKRLNADKLCFLKFPSRDLKPLLHRTQVFKCHISVETIEVKQLFFQRPTNVQPLKSILFVGILKRMPINFNHEIKFLIHYKNSKIWIHSLTFRGSMLWSILPDMVSSARMTTSFKAEVGISLFPHVQCVDKHCK